MYIGLENVTYKCMHKICTHTNINIYHTIATYSQTYSYSLIQMSYHQSFVPSSFAAPFWRPPVPSFLF